MTLRGLGLLVVFLSLKLLQQLFEIQIPNQNALDPLVITSCNKKKLAQGKYAFLSYLQWSQGKVKTNECQSMARE